MSTWRTVAHGWRVFSAAVLVLALIQAATVAPGLTPGLNPWFALLTVASLAASACAVTVIAASARAAADRAGFRWPAWPLWGGSLLATVATVAASIATPLLAPPVIVLALVVLPGIAARDGRLLAGPAMFRAAPLHASVLAVGSLVLIALLWVMALLLGFFVTGPIAAFITWLVFGCAGVFLMCAWTTRYDRTRAAEATTAATSAI